MSSEHDKLQKEIRLLSLPERLRNFIPKTAETELKLRFLEINGKTPALESLAEFLQNDLNDVKKLAKNIRLQLGSKRPISNPTKVQTAKGRKQKGIIEIKATQGKSRLFAFFSQDGNLIICTHAYWKSDSSNKKQNREFEKAASLRNEYMAAVSKKE